MIDYKLAGYISNMINIFLEKSEYQGGIVKFSDFEYLKQIYVLDVNNITNYYHNRVYAIRNTHLLVRLLNSLDVPMDYPVDQYASVAETRATHLAGVFDISSSLHRGRLFDGVFYGPGSQEIIISDNDYFNPYYAEKHWTRIRAVKTLLHPKSDLGILLPNGRKTMTGDGLSAFSINIPLLAVQYRSFMLSQRMKYQSGGGFLGANHFIHMYVLPNMLYDHMDWVLLNRMKNLFYGAPMGTALIKHPFLVIDYGKKLDRVLERCIYSIQKRQLRYEILLKSIPAIFAEDQQEALLMPDVAPTMQIRPHFLMARLGIIRFMMELGGQNDRSMNLDFIYPIQRKILGIKAYLNENDTISETIRMNILDDIDFIVNF